MIHFDRHSFLMSLFADLHDEAIPFCILASPTSNLADIRDIDVACEKQSISKIMPFLILTFLKKNLYLSRIVFRSYCVQLIFSLPSDRIIHIDLMYYFISGFNRIAEAKNFIQNSYLVDGVPYASIESLELYNNKKKYFSHRKSPFFAPLLKPFEFLSIVGFRFSHLISVIFVQPKRIAILGVDGSGKSTIAKVILQQLSSTLRGPVKFYYLFRGVFPRYRTSLNSSTNRNPHSTRQRSLFLQFLKLFYMSLELTADTIFTTLFPQPWSVFDRYSYDLYLDRVRYGLSLLPVNMLKRIIDTVSVQPLFLFVLYGEADILYSRKKEISIHTLEQLLNNYTQISFPTVLPILISINTSQYDLKSSTSIVASVLNTHVSLIPWR